MRHHLIRAVALALAFLFVFLSAALAYDKLERGMEGSDVMNMQLALRSLG